MSELKSIALPIVGAYAGFLIFTGLYHKIRENKVDYALCRKQALYVAVAVAIMLTLTRKEALVYGILITVLSIALFCHGEFEKFEILPADKTQNGMMGINNTTVVLPGCLNVTRQDLLSSFGNDKEALVEAMLIAKVPLNLEVVDFNAPWIATLLVMAGYKLNAPCMFSTEDGNGPEEVKPYDPLQGEL